MPRKHQCNAEELAARHAAIREALAQCMSSHDIEAGFAEQWKVDPRTIRGYMAKVRADVAKVKLVTMTPEQRAIEQNLVVDGIKATIAIAMGKTDARNKAAPDLKAAQRGYQLLGQVYGVFVERVELGGPGGGPIPLAGSPGLTAMLQKLEADAKKRGAAK